MSTGWTLDYVGNHLDLPRLKTLNKYWKKFPPVHVLIASYVGYKEPAEETPASKDQNIMDFLTAFPQRKPGTLVADHDG